VDLFEIQTVFKNYIEDFLDIFPEDFTVYPWLIPDCIFFDGYIKKSRNIN